MNCGMNDNKPHELVRMTVWMTEAMNIRLQKRNLTPSHSLPCLHLKLPRSIYILEDLSTWFWSSAHHVTLFSTFRGWLYIFSVFHKLTCSDFTAGKEGDCVCLAKEATCSELRDEVSHPQLLQTFIVTLTQSSLRVQSYVKERLGKTEKGNLTAIVMDSFVVSCVYILELVTAWTLRWNMGKALFLVFAFVFFLTVFNLYS